MSKIFSLSLYHSSFAPLWLSILFIDIKSCMESSSNHWTEIICIGCIIVSFVVSLVIMLPMMLGIAKKEGTAPQTIVSATEEKTIIAEYLLSYILPLLAFDFTQWSHVVLFLLFYVTLGFLCIRHNYFTVNIILEIVNFRFYTCRLQNEDGIIIEQRVISQRRMNCCIGEILYLKPLNNEYRLDIRQ